MSIEAKIRQHLPELDFGVLGHGFTEYIRDYAVVVQIAGRGPAAGTHRCLFTHCVLATVETRVRDDVWPCSWGDEFIDYDAWNAAGQPNGFFWGSKWSLAYPGLRFVTGSTAASDWSTRIGKPMHEVWLETYAFALRLIFHDFHMSRLSAEQRPVIEVLVPLPSRNDA